MPAVIILVVGMGIAVASLACLRDAYLRGVKKGRQRENWRIRRLYITRRAACEFELITGQPVETARLQGRAR